MTTGIEGIAGLIGLSRRGGRLAVGFGACVQALVERKATLIILAEDLSPSTAEKVRIKMEGSAVALVVRGNKQDWGKVLGRDAVGVMAVLDNGLAKAIMQKMGSTGQ